MTSTDPHHETAVDQARREWMTCPLAIGEPVISAVIDGSGRCANVVERVALHSLSRDGFAQSRRFEADGTRPWVTRLVRAWDAGRAGIPMGLIGSALTCVASATANALFDASGGGILSSTYLKRLTVGYSAAAAVVITLFPLLPALFRRLAGRRRPCRARRPGT